MKRTVGLVAVCVAALAAGVGPVAPAAAADWVSGWTSLDDPRLSQPVYPRTVFEKVPMVMDDGTKLDAHVIRPVVPAGTRLPVIMHASPYFGSLMQPDQILPELQRLKYAQRGYVLAGVAIRGSGGSQGCLDYQGVRDRADIDRVVDVLARQPWSNGKVGGIGLSWAGTTLTSAVVTGNPRLATVVPAEAIVDWYKWSFMRGVPAWFVGYSFNIYAPPTVHGATFGASRSRLHVARNLHQRACLGTPPAVMAQAHSAVLSGRDAWWDERDLTRYAHKAHPDLAVLMLTGYRDEGVRPDHYREWDRALRDRLPNYRMLAGDWGHLWPDTPNIPAARNEDVMFNPHPVTSWPVVLLRWFDRWLKDKPTGIEAMPRALLQDDDGRWHAEDGYEPTAASPRRLYPKGDGSLSSETPARVQKQSFVDNGLGVDPRGTCAYLGAGFLVGCAPVKAANARFFLGAPLRETTRISGAPRANLQLRHSNAIGHVGVTLYRVRGKKWTPLTYGITTINLPHDDYRFENRHPNSLFTQPVDLLPREIVLRAGDRIGVAIGAQVDRYPMSVGGNGYAPPVSGGRTTLFVGPGTWIELDRMAGIGATVALP